ncbi:adenine nucleotide alpha hydrolase family protein [Nocardiopsis lucentensis]|uniref:hypothetical protein n=1 Tax=Nocardiopsis lucentensis TaxID=53441 RepID=UPI00034DE795|nr:hypothetical protein [Nocardiopsis lucentensis]
MPDPTTPTVHLSSHLEPDPQALDLSRDVTATIPRYVRASLSPGDRRADLWWIAAACFAVDRQLKRPHGRLWRQGEEWTRKIHARIPVSDPVWWSEHAPLVSRLLDWLTADRWRLEFVAGPQPEPFVQETLDEGLFDQGDAVALFSGGLDSVSGLIADLEEGADTFCTVSVSTNDRMTALQRRIFDRVRGHNARLREAHHFVLRVRPTPRESTARTRGLVFLTAGVVAALARDRTCLRLYENGPGALNLALSQAQVGAQSARAVHPRTLQYMETLASAVHEDAFTIVNRCMGLTKARMVARVPPRYDQALLESVSCDTGFAHHVGHGQVGSGTGSRPAHCGGCSSCVLRRQALAAAGRGTGLPQRGVPKHKREHHALMGWQVARLRHAMRDGLSWRRMVQEFPDLVCDPGSFDPARRRELLDLFRDYAREWDLPSVIEEFGVRG